MESGERYGDWITRERLGGGGGGEVWLCAHAQTGGLGAIKLLRGEASREDRARFMREMRALEHLQHPSIVRLLDSGFTQDAWPWLVMEYVAGEDLERVLSRGEPLPYRTCLRIFAELADGLTHVHDSGFQHRDVKAANVILRADGSATLVDFGAAIEADATGVTTLGIVLGTFAYMPPEVLSGGERDPILGDIYALGQLLCEALTGQLLYRGNAGHVIGQKLVIDHLDPGEGFDPRLRKVIRAATRQEPEERLQSMRELHEALLAILQGDPTPLGVRRSEEIPPEPAVSAFGRIAPSPPAAPSPEAQEVREASPTARRSTARLAALLSLTALVLLLTGFLLWG